MNLVLLSCNDRDFLYKLINSLLSNPAYNNIVAQARNDNWPFIITVSKTTYRIGPIKRTVRVQVGKIFL